MSDKISISFTNEIFKTESIALFSHCQGENLLEIVDKYLGGLMKFLETLEANGFSQATPLARLEPETVMVDFIRGLTLTHYKRRRIESDLYLGKDETDGDNSDNGHHKIELTEYLPEKRKQELEELEHQINKQLTFGAIIDTAEDIDMEAYVERKRKSGEDVSYILKKKFMKSCKK